MENKNTSRSDKGKRDGRPGIERMKKSMAEKEGWD